MIQRWPARSCKPLNEDPPSYTVKKIVVPVKVGTQCQVTSVPPPAPATVWLERQLWVGRWGEHALSLPILDVSGDTSVSSSSFACFSDTAKPRPQPSFLPSCQLLRPKKVRAFRVVRLATSLGSTPRHSAAALHTLGSAQGSIRRPCMPISSGRYSLSGIMKGQSVSIISCSNGRVPLVRYSRMCAPRFRMPYTV